MQRPYPYSPSNYTDATGFDITCPVFVSSVWTVFDGSIASDRDIIICPEQLNYSTSEISPPYRGLVS
ncbi:hypothetical protein ACP6PM_05515 [Dapis sp. BLCC M229]